MTNSTPKAYSYIRWSSEKQTSGDSLRRQTEAARTWAVAHGIELDETTSYLDAGVSGLTGRNAKRGALHSFLRAVEDGIIPLGSYLLVESLDRLSRQSPWDAMPLFQQIINEGVNIVTLQDDRVWNSDELRVNPFRIMESLMVMIRANEESVTKSKRVRAARERNRRDAASGKITTSKVPAWLKTNAGKTEIEVVEERAHLVRRIYEMADAGMGHTAIAKTLNGEGISSFGSPTSRVESGVWNKTYISKLLHSKAPAGVLEQYESKEPGSDGPARIKVGEVPGYYPVVVPQDLAERVWLKAQAVQPKGHHANLPIQNLFAGVGRCPICGTVMARQVVSKRHGGDRLRCNLGKVGGCSSKSVQLRRLVDAVKLHLDDLLDVRERFNSPVDVLSHEMEVDAARDAMQDLAARIAEEPALIVTLRQASEQADGRLARAQKALRDAVEAAEVASGQAWGVESARFRAALAGDDIPGANTALRRMAQSVQIHLEDREMVFEWRDGTSSQIGWDLASDF